MLGSLQSSAEHSVASQEKNGESGHCSPHGRFRSARLMDGAPPVLGPLTCSDQRFLPSSTREDSDEVKCLPLTPPPESLSPASAFRSAAVGDRRV